MSSDITTLALPKVINEAMAGLRDGDVSLDDRVAFYSLLHQVQLRINRVLRQAKKDGLVEEIVRDHPEGIGPITVAWEAFDVEWPCNDESNWGDVNVQEAMAVLSLISPEYFRHIPDHFEVNTAALGEAVHMGDPVARQLHTECKDRGWRTEGGRRAALKVREAKTPKGKAA
jgi:hypothetical protein